MGRPLQGPDLFEHRVTAYLEEFFRGLGVPYERQPTAPGRDNIVARCDVPGARRTLVLEAHQDTVPTDQMTIDPFGAKIENGRLYGRGACDIKGGLAAMLAAFARIVRDRPRGAANVVMACSVDGAGIDVPFTSMEPWMCNAALSPHGSERLVAARGRAIDAVRGAHQVMAVPYGTDASTIAEAGIPAVVFGPGDIAQAHTCDEWVDLEEVAAAAEILYGLACMP